MVNQEVDTKRDQPQEGQPQAPGSQASAVHTDRSSSEQLSEFPEQSDDDDFRPIKPRRPLNDESTQDPWPPCHEFTGILILADGNRWKQKVYLSYELLFRPERDNDTYYTQMQLDKLQVRVTQSVIDDEIKPPQFRVRRAKVTLQPRVKQIHDDNRGDYCDLWLTTNQHPSEDTYRCIPSTRSNEQSIAGRVQAGMPSQVQVEVSRSSGRSFQLPPIAQMVDLPKSVFVATPNGGLLWDYEILASSAQGNRGYAGFQLQAHRGLSIIPKQNPPSSMSASWTAIFEAAASESQPRLIFGLIGLAKRPNNIPIGYRHFKLSLQTDVGWCNRHLAMFPRESASKGHHLPLKYMVNDGLRDDNKSSHKAADPMQTTQLVLEKVEKSKK